jgi:uncharacterized coiled-coil DUF342 family protein
MELNGISALMSSIQTRPVVQSQPPENEPVAALNPLQENPETYYIASNDKLKAHCRALLEENDYLKAKIKQLESRIVYYADELHGEKEKITCNRRTFARLRM